MAIPESCCPCGYRMTDCTNIHGDDSDPEPGDISVCLNCGQVLVFDSDLSLCKPTVEQIREIMADESAWNQIERAQQLIRERNRGRSHRPLPREAHK